MKTTHIKNIVIWALVVINAFFLVFWLLGLAVDYGDKIEKHQNLKVLVEQNGITMDIRCIHEGGELFTLESFRNSTKEQALVNTLLGSNGVTIQGNSRSYTGDSGSAVFKNSGEFQITLLPGIVTNAPGTENAVRHLLQKMDIEAKIDTAIMTGDHPAGTEAITAVSTWNSQEIFNCRILFVFKNGSLAEISGQYSPDIRPTAVKTDVSSCTTAVMSFLYEVRNGKFSCTEILDIRPGYNLTVSLDEGSLDPVWRIETDSGVFYVNGLTGSVDKAAE